MELLKLLLEPTKWIVSILTSLIGTASTGLPHVLIVLPLELLLTLRVFTFHPAAAASIIESVLVASGISVSSLPVKLLLLVVVRLLVVFVKLGILVRILALALMVPEAVKVAVRLVLMPLILILMLLLVLAASTVWIGRLMLASCFVLIALVCVAEHAVSI